MDTISSILDDKTVMKLTTKQSRQLGLIELFYKTYNLYKLYRIRYDNTLPLLHFLSDDDVRYTLPRLQYKIAELEKSMKAQIDSLYIDDILNITDTSKLSEDSILYTLRIDTTHLISEMVFNNKFSRKLCKPYEDKISKIVVSFPTISSELNEIKEKVRQINGLISSGITSLDDSAMLEDVGDGFNPIRNGTNLIINIIGDNNATSTIDNNYNHRLNDLFKFCFKIILIKFFELSKL